jgi:hypothetical protein
LIVKRTSRHSQKRTSRRTFHAHTCASNAQGLCYVCGKLMDSHKFHGYTGVEANARGRVGAAKELDISEGIGLVREASPDEQLGFLPPGAAARIAKMPAGLYSYGFGKNGESIRPFRQATLGGALTSTRIAAQKSREYHWLVDNRLGYPVVARIFDNFGNSAFRVEEYAKTLARQPVKVGAKTKRTSRSRAA